MLRTGPTGNLTHQYEMLRDVTKRRQYLTTWDGNVLDWRHKCCCLTATTESKGHHHLGWDINHTKMAHCFGQSLPQGICGVALIGTYQSCVKKEKKKKEAREREFRSCQHSPQRTWPVAVERGHARRIVSWWNSKKCVRCSPQISSQRFKKEKIQILSDRQTNTGLNIAAIYSTHWISEFSTSRDLSSLGWNAERGQNVLKVDWRTFFRQIWWTWVVHLITCEAVRQLWRANSQIKQYLQSC